MSEVAAKLITIETDDGPMPAHLWQPHGETGPGLVLVQEIFGVSRYIQDRGRDLAALGYVVCAPEIYWRLDDHDVDEDSPDVLDQAISLAQRVDWDAAISDLQDTLSHLRGMIEVEGGIGVIGFCFGGGLAFHVAAVDDIDVLVDYYGSAIRDLTHLAGKITAPSLHHFGLADAVHPARSGQTDRGRRDQAWCALRDLPGRWSCVRQPLTGVPSSGGLSPRLERDNRFSE